MSTAPALADRSAPGFRPIDHPSAWTSEELGGAEGLIYRLSSAQRDGLLRLADALAGREVAGIERSDVADPEIVALMRAVRFELARSKGAVVISGLDVSGLDEERFARLFWALGTHIGQGAVQSSKRDLIGRVEKRDDNPEQRGYQLDIELGSHCDFHEYLALACFRKADNGGESGLVSALAIHNEMARTRPDLLDALYRGFPHQCATPEDRSAHDIPVFCDVDGVVSCFSHRLFYTNAARDTGVPVPAALDEAMALFDTLSRREDLRATFMLQPGEMMFWHNFVNLHSRNSFKDRPDHRRLLFRLWMHAREGEGRPMMADFVDRARAMDRVHEQGRPGIIYRLDQSR